MTDVSRQLARFVMLIRQCWSLSQLGDAGALARTTVPAATTTAAH